VAGTVEVAQTSKAELARMTIGREVLFDIHVASRELGPVVFAAEDVRVVDDDGSSALDGVSLEVHAGEIVGVAGVDGNGQRELAEVLTGLLTPTHGRLRFGDEWVEAITPLEFSRKGGSVIPADRHHTSLALNLSVRDNLLMKELAMGRLQRRGIIDDSAADAFCERLIAEYEIRTPDSRTKVRQLSGGNQQKVVLARELCRQPRLLIAAQPTRGLDVGATETVLGRLQQERDRGCAILFISTELEELMQLSDRVAVMVEGKFLAVLDRKDATYEQLGLLMGGEAIDPEDEMALLVEELR
jgi:simple sugar transport system ATP-binding protein